MVVKGQRFASSLLQSPVFVIVVLTLIGAALRIYHLGYKSLWYDEALLYRISSGNLMDVLSRNAITNSSPPLFPVLLNLAMHVSTNDVVLRLTACLAGILTIPAMYLLAVRFISRYAAYTAALLVTLSTQQVLYAQQVREYSLTMLFSILILFAFVRFLAQPSRKNNIALAVALVLGIFTQYGITLLDLALNLVFVVYLLRSRSRDLLLKWIIIQLIALMVAVLVFVIALQMQWVPGGTGGADYLQAAYWDGTLNSLLTLAISHTADIVSFAFEGPLIFFFVALGIVTIFLARRRVVVLLLIIVTFAVTFTAALLRLYPYAGGRHLIFLTPLVYLVASIGFDYLIRNKQILVTSLLLVTVVVAQAPNVTSFLNWAGDENVRPLMAALSQSIQPTDRVYVFYGAIPAFMYYARSSSFPAIYGLESERFPQVYLDQIDQIFKTNGRVWLLFSHCYFPQECIDILDHASHERTVELVAASDVQTALYLAH